MFKEQAVCVVIGYVTGALWNGSDFHAHCKVIFKCQFFKRKWMDKDYQHWLIYILLAVVTSTPDVLEARFLFAIQGSKKTDKLDTL